MSSAETRPGLKDDERCFLHGQQIGVPHVIIVLAKPD